MPQTGGKRTKTRKQKKILTIPELRKSLDYISTYASSLVQTTKDSVKELSSKFAKEWKKVFGKTLSPKVAEAYIKSLMKVKRGTRKLRGGAVLTGAPLDYLTRPGVDLPYGNFQTYVQKGFVNPEPAILKDCGIQKGVEPYAGMTGDTFMKGGNWSAALMRPFVATNPTSFQHDAMMGLKGQQMPPGPESWQKAWQPHMNPHSPPALTTILAHNRDLIEDNIKLTRV